MSYLLWLVAWFGPVIAAEWAAGWRELRNEWPPLVAAVTMATLYLGFADIAAMRDGVWEVVGSRTLGLDGGGFVFEQWVSLALLNTAIAQAAVLAFDRGFRARAIGWMRRR
ncbi:MAG: hypothetical protein LC118_08385 [Dehalococcoidia bacterium]|nr:hypothetical protein [Dehalococcoidia bacterium]